MDKVFEVQELTNYIGRLLSEDIFLSRLKVAGEVSNFNHHSSGHMYFTLKDDRSKLKCIMFKGYNQKLDFDLENGMDVVLEGSISVYEREGQYQIYVKSIELAGMGELYLEYERLKKQLEEEGLFDLAYKKTIPQYPRRIGLVTSATGAAIQDILNVMGRRYPLAEVFICPSLVQGKEASEEIISALITLDNYDLDTIILARGGGAIEDLFVFNDEDLARIIFALKTPIITGIGHEIDFTIADFVADLRAPTPSAAAELATPDADILADKLDEKFNSILSLTRKKLDDSRQTLLGFTKDINYYNPQLMVNESYQNLDFKLDRLIRDYRLEEEKSRLDLLGQRIASIDPRTILNRGYSILIEDQIIVDSLDKVNEESTYKLKLRDGEVEFKFNILNRKGGN